MPTQKDLFRSVKGKNLHPSSLLHVFPSFDFVHPRCKWQRSHQPGALSTMLALVPTRSHISYRRQRQRRRPPWQGQSRSHRLKRKRIKRIGSVGAAGAVAGAVGTPRNQSKFGAEELLMLKKSLPSHRTARTETDAASFELIFQILLLKRTEPSQPLTEMMVKFLLATSLS